MNYVGKLIQSLVAFFFILQSPLFAQSSNSSGEWWEIEYQSFIGSAAIFDASLTGACKRASYFGNPQIYYKGVYFKYVETGHNAGKYKYKCVAQCPECDATQKRDMPVYKICTTFQMVDGVKTRKTSTQDLRQCVPPCDPCSMKVGNPVEISSLTKVTTAIDWSAPNESRFKIERIYRSDSAFSARFDGTTTSPYDLFGGAWQRTYSDLLYWHGNPYDPTDTTWWWKHEKPDGTAIHIANDQPTRALRGQGYELARDGSARTVKSPDGIVRHFWTTRSTPYVLVGTTWPDGYSISVDLWNGKQAAGMTDNKGNRATFVFNQNVFPGTNRNLISEIIISRKSGTIYVETGRLIYTYSALSWPSISETDNPHPTAPSFINAVQPVITGVDYLAAGATVPTIVWRYTYSTALPPSPTNPDGSQDPVQAVQNMTPMLTSISDSGQGPYAEYTYKFFGSDATGRYIGFGVASERYAGDAVAPVFHRDATADVHTVKNPKGIETEYEFRLGEWDKNVAAIEVASGIGVLPTRNALSYGTEQVVSQVVNRNGSKTILVRDTSNRIVSMTEDADGLLPRTTTFTWHSKFNFPLSRTTEDLVETFTYDVAGILLSYSQTDTRVGSPTHNQTRTWTYNYTTLSNGLKVLAAMNGPGLVADGINDVTTYAYTPTGDLVSATDANGLITSVLSRNLFGQPTLIEQPDRSIWSFTYDGEGRVATVGFAAPGQTPLVSSFVYNHSDQVTAYTNSRGKTWIFSYNAARRLVSSTSPMGDKVSYTYDGAGNVVREAYSVGANPATFWEGSEFDGLNRLLKTVGAMGQEWDYSHDREDNLTAVTDPLNHTTTSGYDALNRLISTVDRESYTTGMEYNPADQLTEYTDPRAIETDFIYNGFGEVISEVSADRGTISYTYDRRGLVTSRTDGRGITVSYAYDNGGRIKLIDYPSGGLPDIVFTYDTPFAGVPANSNKGHVGRISDGLIDTQFGHEVTATGPRVIAIAAYPGGRSYTVIEETDFEGNPTRTVYPSGREILFETDDDNRISSIKLKDGAIITPLMQNITYMPMGPMVSALFGDGYTQTRTYDLSYRLTGIKDALGAAKLRDVTMGYEGRDNLASITDTLTPANSETFLYTPRESLSGATGPYGTLGYTYDGVGNRLTAALGPATDTYLYPLTSNRLTSISLASGVVRGFTYDAAGNVIAEARTGGGTYGYTYNAAGRMETFSINGFLQASYKYDAMGRQAIRTLTSPTAVTIHSVFDSGGRRIAEYNETSGALIREYVWNGWEPVAVIEGGVVSFVRADHIGRPVFATNSSGVKVWSAAYTPFGGVHVATGAPPTARFPGQWFQSESGLHQNWMRDYDPTTGRYLQADPLGLVDGASVYGYVKQSPMSYTDPRGEQSLGDGFEVLKCAYFPVMCGRPILPQPQPLMCTGEFVFENCLLIDEVDIGRGETLCVYDCPSSGIQNVPVKGDYCPILPDIPVYKP